MGTGKLYKAETGEFIANVSYQFQSELLTSWWGELTLVEYRHLTDGGSYIIELEDMRRGRCFLKKRVNRAVNGIPPRYTYHFTGAGAFNSSGV